ncbi:MAG: MurR/RpiR family transcriptional regulator [Oscillospiraceae bacterium]|nr:MurR/RpiR family transcriptional regulator [Oscillospiraceae bacterium]
MANRDVLQRISDSWSGLSKGQKRIAEYIRDNFDKVSYLTAAQLGRQTDVSESTVVRFATRLGYDGFPDLQRSLQATARNKLTSVQRIQVAQDRIGGQDVLTSVMQSDMENIRATLNECDREEFYGAVDALVSARRIYILGVRSSAGLASFLGFYLHLILDNVSTLQSNSASEMFEQILRVGKKDVVIGISFPRYSKRIIQAMKFARDQGAGVIAVTDNPSSPLTVSASHVLLAKSDMASFADSLAAPLSLLNALIVETSRRTENDLAGTLERLENIWEEYQVYEKADEGF